MVGLVNGSRSELRSRLPILLLRANKLVIRYGEDKELTEGYVKDLWDE